MALPSIGINIMSTNLEKIEEILPSVLPKNPDKSISGVELSKKIKKKLKDLNENTIKVCLSVLANTPSSSITRPAGRYGYYLKEDFYPGVKHKLPKQIEDEKKREQQLEEKFRSIFMRYKYENDRELPIHIEHTKVKKSKAGIDKWKFPDVALVKWEVENIDEDKITLDQTLMEVKKSLGEQPFKVSSCELKVVLKTSNFREYFFQCVSNSKWAHHAVLATASIQDDKTLEKELSRLGNSYDVTILSFDLSEEYLESLPDANKILNSLSDEEFTEIVSKMSLRLISSSIQKDNIDWEHVKDLKAKSTDFNDLVQWIARCVTDSSPYTIDEFRELRKNESNNEVITKQYKKK